MFIAILAVVYLCSVNLFGFLLLRMQRNDKQKESKYESVVSSSENDSDISSKNHEQALPEASNKRGGENKISNAKLFFVSAIGGALGVYISMLIAKYKLRSLPFMVGIPILLAANGYFFFLVFSQWLYF